MELTDPNIIEPTMKPTRLERLDHVFDGWIHELHSAANTLTDHQLYTRHLERFALA